MIILLALMVNISCTLNETNHNTEVDSYDAQITTRSGVEWDYPVKPGSEEWRMTSYDYKIEKSQPPKWLLASWSIEVLFRFCIDYPFNKVTLLFNNPNDGFKRAYEQSSVWKEFIQRKDALEVFAQFIEARPYKLLFEITDIEVCNNELFTLFFLEKVVSETDFVGYLNSTDKKKLADIILRNHQDKKNYPQEFFGFPYNSSLTTLLKILESENIVSSKGDYSLTSFREKTGNEYFVDDELDLAITTLTSNYVNKQ